LPEGEAAIQFSCRTGQPLTRATLPMYEFEQLLDALNGDEQPSAAQWVGPRLQAAIGRDISTDEFEALLESTIRASIPPRAADAPRQPPKKRVAETRSDPATGYPNTTEIRSNLLRTQLFTAREAARQLAIAGLRSTRRQRHTHQLRRTAKVPAVAQATSEALATQAKAPGPRGTAHSRCGEPACGVRH